MRLSFRKKKNTSDKIKEATLSILARDGYEDISMRKIAKEANVALGQLTYYYKTKNNLIVSVIDEVLDMFYSGLENRVKGSKNKVEGIIDGIEEALSEDNLVNKLLITVFSMAQVNKKLNKSLKSFYDNTIELVSNCFKQDNPNISGEESQIKARLLAGTTIETMIEKSIGFGGKNSTLIRDAAKRLGA